MPRQAAAPPASFYDRVYAVVSQVPFAHVVTFGQVAALAGSPRAARATGYALHALPWESPVPWWRVVNVTGAISLRAGPGPALQRQLLVEEGVIFGLAGCIDLERFGWLPARGP
jgi:methylated-DNA-protein-cysteine methyltransferase-like protein